jgi:hypothetical protein
MKPLTTTASPAEENKDRHRLLHMAEEYSDEEVKSTFESLPEEVVKIALKKLDNYKKTGEYYVISITGVTKEVSKLMERLTVLI